MTTTTLSPLAVTLPENITLLERMCDLPHGTLSMWRVDNEADAADCANGRTAYLYHSKIIKATYLYIPIMEAL